MKLNNHIFILLFLFYCNDGISQNVLKKFNTYESFSLNCDSINYDIFIISGNYNCSGCVIQLRKLIDSIKLVDTNFSVAAVYELDSNSLLNSSKYSHFYTLAKYNLMIDDMYYLFNENAKSIKFPYIILKEKNIFRTYNYSELFNDNNINSQIKNQILKNL